MTDYYSSAVFVNDNTVVICAGNEMAAVNVDGTLLFQEKLAGKRSFGIRPVASSGGERYTVIENRQRGVTIEFLDIDAFPSPDRVVVYSIADRRAIYSVKVKDTWPGPPSALSPDGSLLAIVSDGILKVYGLPSSSAARHFGR